MRILILAIVALAAIMGGALFLGTESPTLPDDMKNAQIVDSASSDGIFGADGEKAWIEILSGKAFEFDKNGKLIKELKTGDSLEEKRIVDAGTGALANIYFPNGSILKIDSETKIEIKKSEYQKTNGKLVVNIFLTLGRVWSQIKSLTTDDSEWQVETPNAIAAVRGTSFGIEFTKGKSTVVVIENKVEVSAKDEKTDEIIEKSKSIVKENELGIIDEKRILKLEKASEEILNRAWIKRNIEAKKSDEIIKVGEEKTTKELRQKTKISETQKAVNLPTPRELKLTQKASLEKIIEGESVKFEAILVLSDNSEKVVTSEVIWQTLGGIGIMGKGGTFIAKLDYSVSEFGSAFGNVIAVWKDKNSDKEILGKTPIFKVEAQIIEEPVENVLEPRG